MAGTPIKLKGLAPIVTGLKQLGSRGVKALETAGMNAAEMIVSKAKPLVPLGPGIGGHARDSLRAQKGPKGPEAIGGGPRFPYYPWLDFGGRVGINRSVKRPFIREGRFIWPTYNKHEADIEDMMRDELIDVLKKAGLM